MLLYALNTLLHFSFYLFLQGDIIDSIVCSDVEKERIGDGKCDPKYNTEACRWDGGDCCKESCHEEFSFYPCGSGMQSFVCMDPRFMVRSSVRFLA